MKTSSCLIAVLLLSFQLQAQTKPILTEEPPVPHQKPESAVEVTDQPTVVPAPESANSRMSRALTRYTGSAHWSPLSTWIPSKFGFSAGYVFNENWTLEGEYTSKSISASFQSVDFGQIVDRRYGIQGRWYPGTSNSFHFIVGLFKSEFSAEIGSTILNNVSGTPSSTLVKFQSMGPQLGLANRWQWQNGIGFGIDWLVMYMPLFNKSLDNDVLNSVTNTTDRSDIDKVTSVVSNIPQFDLLRLQLGYSF